MLNIKQMNGVNSVTEVIWSDARDECRIVNSELSEIIDEINPNKDMPLIRVSYAFGDQIFENGEFVLLRNAKDNANSLATKDMQKLINYLDYSSVPFGLCLRNSIEVYLEMVSRIVPLYVLSPGYTIGLYEALDNLCGKSSSSIWNVTAGARSAFMLPKINNSINHQRLIDEYGVSNSLPRLLSAHWNIFKQIINAPGGAAKDWSCELLFFTRPWFEHVHDNDSGWNKLREYLFRECWIQSGSVIEKTFALIWQQFSSSATKRRYKPRIYVTDTIRHLVGIAYGFVPGFVPVGDSELLGPFNTIKDAYVNVYELKDYLPTLMAPSWLTKKTPSVYYSLGYPTLLEGCPEVMTSRNTIENLREIKALMDNMYAYCNRQGLTAIRKFSNFIENVSFDYFHKILDAGQEICDTGKIFQEDKSFHELPQHSNQREFCTTAPFMNGCVRIKGLLKNELHI